MSNSLSAVNSNVAKSGKADYNVEEVQKLHIKALNKLLTSEDENDDEGSYPVGPGQGAAIIPGHESSEEDEQQKQESLLNSIAQ